MPSSWGARVPYRTLHSQGGSPVAVWGAGEDAHDASLRQVALATPAALEHPSPFVFGEHALELKEEIVFRGVADRPIEEHDLHTGARELLNQHGLMRIRPGQTIGGVDVDKVNGGDRDQIAQTLQGGPDQTGPTVAIVEEAEFLTDLVAVGGRLCQEIADLTVDGLAFNLLVGGHARVNRRSGRDEGFNPPALA